MNSFEPMQVLCPLDLEPSSTGLIATATALAARFDARLHLLHVWDPRADVTDERASGGRTLDADPRREAISARLQQAACVARRSHRDVRSALVSGTPWEEIVAFAAHHRVDLIVTGTQERTWLSRLLRGSLAERVLRAVNVPVLVVPIRGDAPALVSSSPRTRAARVRWHDES